MIEMLGSRAKSWPLQFVAHFLKSAFTIKFLVVLRGEILLNVVLPPLFLERTQVASMKLCDSRLFFLTDGEQMTNMR
jgi:hypothetical protein